MNTVRSLGLLAAVGAAAVLTGCVAAGPGYYGDSGYGQPYYSDPSPVIVSPPPVYIQGGGYYGGGRPVYREPYYGRRDYPAVRPGYGPRPGFVPPRAVQPVQPAQRGTPGYPRPYAVPPAGRGAPGAVVQPSWNNQERP